MHDAQFAPPLKRAHIDFPYFFHMNVLFRPLPAPVHVNNGIEYVAITAAEVSQSIFLFLYMY